MLRIGQFQAEVEGFFQFFLIIGGGAFGQAAVAVINHTGLLWVKTAAMMCGFDYGTEGEGVHIVEEPMGNADEIVLNSGDVKIIGPRPDNKDFIYVSISRQSK